MNQYKKIFLLALATQCMSSCSFDNRVRLPPDISSISHAAMATCTPNPTDVPRSCLMLASAQKQHMWAVDMETGAVVPAKNRLFALTVPLQAFTPRLAALPNEPFVWALDGPKGQLFAVPIQGKQALAHQQSFTFSNTQKPAIDMTLFRDNTQRPTALITVPEQKQVHVLPLNKDTGIADDKAGFAMDVGTNPQHIATDPASQWAVITNPASTQVHVLPLVNLEKNSSVQSIDVGHPTRLVAIGNAQLAPQQPLQTIAVVVGESTSNENNTAVAETHITWIHLQDTPTKLAQLRIQNQSQSNAEDQSKTTDKKNKKENPNKGFVQVVYMPSGNNILPCCGQQGQQNQNLEPWAAIATTDGTLMYIALNEQKQLRVAEEIQLSDKNQLGSRAVSPVAFVGGKLLLPQNSSPPSNMCERQMFLVFPSLVASFCEGSSSIRQL